MKEPKKKGRQAAPGPADVTVPVSDKPQESLNEDQTTMLRCYQQSLKWTL